VRILVVGEDFPWPAVGGGIMRLANVVRALAEVGEVDLFALLRQARREPPTVPPGLALHRLATVRYPPPPAGWRWRASWLPRRGVPWEVVKAKVAVTGRPEFEQFAEPPYDVVWFSTAALYAWMGRPDLGPTIVDLMDLESEKRRRKLALNWSERPRQRLAHQARLAVSLGQDRLNARDWGTFERKVAQSVDRVVLCFDEDVTRTGFTNAVTVPNTFDRPAAPLGRSEVSDPPVVLFQGTLSYVPNVDGAQWFVRSVLPLLQQRIPGVQLRLVGTPSAAVKRLHLPPAVTVVGRVDAMEDELARADLSIVPIRYGGGTRLKILESFAHRLPVVSTSMGAEGLHVTDGEHLLLADDAEGFAAACARALGDVGLRHSLADAAERRYLERYEGERARELVRQLARDVASSASSRR
jgi:glycosyltransferase involved in cell wall biosynthesis